MGIRKKEFYEGAALYILARSGGIKSIQYKAPFFLLNEDLLVYFKYSAKGRSPWGFTFTADEQLVLENPRDSLQIVIALICGSDGVAAVLYDEYRLLAAPRESTVHIACYRRHDEHYEVNGPDGKLPGKVPPSRWVRILARRGNHEASRSSLEAASQADRQHGGSQGNSRHR